jgi:hypothetical protein
MKARAGLRRRQRGRAVTAVAVALSVAFVPRLAAAQEFSRYLSCQGSFSANGERQDAHLDLALRHTNGRATVQRSNLLPAGEVMDYKDSPVLYTLTYLLPRQGTQVWVAPGWFESTVFVRYPDLKRLNQIRLAIDRHSGALSGQVLNEADEVLARTDMQCRVRSAEELREPRL